jgi:hypothetical protein
MATPFFISQNFIEYWSIRAYVIEVYSITEYESYWNQSQFGMFLRIYIWESKIGGHNSIALLGYSVSF